MRSFVVKDTDGRAGCIKEKGKPKGEKKAVDGMVTRCLLRGVGEKKRKRELICMQGGKREMCANYGKIRGGVERRRRSKSFKGRKKRRIVGNAVGSSQRKASKPYKLKLAPSIR